jgi:osmotically-inducible protein OsmY
VRWGGERQRRLTERSPRQAPKQAETTLTLEGSMSHITNDQRSDPEIFADARRALDRSPRVPGGVHVHVENGIVTLTGTVRWPFEKAEAARAVRQVAGVRDVVNHIVVFNLTSAFGLEPPDEHL